MCDHLLTLHFFTNKIHAYEKIQIIKQLRLFNSVVVVRFQHFVSKKGVARLSENQMIPVVSQQKTNNQYVVFCNMGHDASTCKGCIAIDGVMYHVDCQGAGEACRKSSCMSLVSTGTSLYATTVDTFGLTSFLRKGMSIALLSPQ